MRPLRPFLAAATASVLVAVALATPASAAPDDVVRQTGSSAGPVPADASEQPDDGVVAPVTDDAVPVAPQVEIVELDDAEVVATAETLEQVVAEVDHTGHDHESDEADQPAEGEQGEVDGAAEEQTTAVDDAATEDATTDDATGDATTDEATGDDATDGAETPDVADEGATLLETADGAELATFVVDTPELAIVGVSWAAGTAGEDVALSYRTEENGAWTDWQDLHVEGDGLDEDEPGARDGAAPVAAVDATRVKVQVSSATGDLPDALSVGVVDPGTSGADDAVSESATTSGSSTGTSGGGGASRGVSPQVGVVPMATGDTPRPTIYSRAQWGADESMMTWTPSQGRVQGIDIHHTVNANDYSSAQVPGLLRGIYAYHAQDWGRGWGDIGYNFIVDRFGRIWEGRYGGVTSAPIGAHATGLNSNMSGISLLGNFDVTPVPSATFTSVAKLAAWKLWIHGVTSPHGTIRLELGTFNRISGHRDAKQTTCPGRYMYDRLPEMRNRIASYLGTFGSRVLDRDLDGDGYPDVVMRNGTSVSVMSSVDQTTSSRTQLGSGWSSTKTAGAGDLNGDGRPDLLLVSAGGTLWMYPSDAQGRFSVETRVNVGSGWHRMTSIASGVDWNGDGRQDLVGQRPDGTLWFYPATSAGRFGSAVLIGSSGWNSMSEISMVPSFVNGRPALLARNTSSGQLYAYPQVSGGLLGSRTALGGGWGARLTITGVPDATGDGIGDLLSTDTNGVLWLYPGTGSGNISSSERQPVGRSGWATTTQVLPRSVGSADMEFFAVRSDGSLWTYDVSVVRHAFQTPRSAGITLASTDRSIITPGDWNGDGRADLMVIKANGALMLHTGNGNGTFSATGRQVGAGWAGFRQVVGAGNWLGDGKPGLIAYDRTAGRLYLYPGDGSGGFRNRVLVSNGADGMDLLAYAGRLNGAGVSDLLMRGADSKRLFLYDGNGGGLAFSPVAVGNGWGVMSNVVGVNDVTFDGRADLIALTSTGQVRIYPGDGAGGFGGYRTVATWGSGRQLW